MKYRVSILTKLRWKIGIFRPQEVEDFIQISYTKGLKDGIEQGKKETAEALQSKTLSLAEQMLDQIVGKGGVDNETKEVTT